MELVFTNINKEHDSAYKYMVGFDLNMDFHALKII